MQFSCTLYTRALHSFTKGGISPRKISTHNQIKRKTRNYIRHRPHIAGRAVSLCRLCTTCGLLGFRLLIEPPFLPPRCNSSCVNLWPLPVDWAVLPPMDAMRLRCSGVIEEKPLPFFSVVVMLALPSCVSLILPHHADPLPELLHQISTRVLYPGHGMPFHPCCIFGAVSPGP